MGEMEDAYAAAQANLDTATTAAGSLGTRVTAIGVNYTNALSAILNLHSESDVDQARIDDAQTAIEAMDVDIQSLISQLTSIGVNPGLTPALSAATSTADGFTVNVTNYDALFTWVANATEGSTTALVDNTNGTATITVSAVDAGNSAVLTVETSRASYGNGVATRSGSALP